MRGRMVGMPADHRPQLLAILANVTAVYPLLVMGLMYSEWSLAFEALGHKPVAWIDDPVESSGAFWIHFVAGWLVIFGMPLAFGTGLISNIAYVRRTEASAAQAGIRASTFAGIWLGFFIWAAFDPNEVSKWWLDSAPYSASCESRSLLHA